MDKTERFDIIKDIIRNSRIEKQAELVAALRGRGVDCTQATVSRDIKALRLTKILSESGTYYYSEPGINEQPFVGKLFGAFANGFLSADYSSNIVVLKTLAGLASACASAIDAVNWPEVVGTLAGDDTILVITKSASASRKIIGKLDSLIMPGN